MWFSNSDVGAILSNQRTILANQGAIMRAIAILQQENEKIMVDLTALTTAVSNETTVSTSVLKLITGMAAQISALAAQPTVDPAALAALAATINANATALSAAVVTNTPSAPAGA
jgi:hypothetical protein